MAKPKRKAEEANKGGRPLTLTPELADHICTELSVGRSLIQICRDDEGMPDIRTVFRWLRREEDGEPFASFCHDYARARELQAHYCTEETGEIADDGRNDWMQKVKDGAPTGELVFNHEAVARSKLRIDERKWRAAMLNPKKYGPKVDLTSGGDALKAAPDGTAAAAAISGFIEKGLRRARGEEDV